MTDQKRIIYLVMAMLILLPLISADVSVSFPDPAVVNLNPTNTAQLVEFQNNNLSQSPTISLSVSSSLENIVQLSQTSLNVPSLNSVTLSIKGNANPGSYSGTLNWESKSIPITVFIETIETATSDITVFPTSKTTNVQQGSEKTQNILVSVPSSYPSPITIEAVDFNPGTETIRFGDLNLGIINPGSSVNIPLIFSGVSAQSGSYNTDLRFSAKDSDGPVNLPTVSLTLQVTQGVSPITEETFNTAPTCSLSATTLNLNQTYSFTCSNTQSNLVIDIPSNNYLIGKKVEVSQGLYRYDFTPIRFGETDFKADFKFNGASIFEPFNQKIRITSSGASSPGTTLDFHFTPSLSEAQEDQIILVQLVDNGSRSLVSEPTILVDALSLNKSDVDTFEVKMKLGETYEFRGKAPGYNDLIKTIELNPKLINISISPSFGNVDTFFNITTSEKNASLIIDGVKVDNPYYSKLSGGLHEIEAILKGFQTSYKNLTVQNSVYVTSGGSEFKKGAEQNLIFNQNTSYVVYYQEDLDGSRDLLLQGTGSSLNFTPEKKGIYSIETSDGKGIQTFEAKGFNWNQKWWFMPWYIWIVGVLALLVFGYFLFIKDSSGSSEAGVMYSVGGGQ